MLAIDILTNGPVPLEQTLTSTIAFAILDAMAVGALLAVIAAFAEARLLAASDTSMADRPRRPSLRSLAMSVLTSRGTRHAFASRVDTKPQ